MQKNQCEKLKMIILELESERDSCQASLEQSRAAALTAKEEFHKSSKQLFEENCRLKKDLVQVSLAVTRVYSR